MKQRFTFLLMAVLTLSLVSFWGCSRQAKNKIIIKGSTTVLPITQKAAEAYRLTDRVSISIEGSGSGNGIKALLDGTADIANSSRAMHEKEINSAKQKGIKTKELIVAYDMIVPIVNKSNRVDDLTLDQIKAIYDGSISNWKQLGGDDAKIIVISRDTSSGTYEVWHEKIMRKADVRRDALLQASNGAIVTAVAGNPKAIGYVGFGYAAGSIKTLKVNGVEPSIENGKSKKFPLSRELFMYVNPDRLSEKAGAFIDFLLGEQGQKLVKDEGFIPSK